MEVNDAREKDGALLFNLFTKFPEVVLNTQAEDSVLNILEQETGDPLFVNVKKERMAFSHEEEKEMVTDKNLLHWNALGEKKYEMGVSQGVLYKKDKTTGKWLGVAWNGLTSVNASPDGGDANDQYADNIKYGSIRGAESYGGTIEAFTSPHEFDSCDGSVEVYPGVTIGQQTREMFRFSYRSEQGNDELGNAYGYKIHLIYGCTCSPTERTHETVNDNPDMETLSWDFDSTPIAVTGHKPTSEIIIDSTLFKSEAEKEKLQMIEDILYGIKADATAGTAEVKAEMPDPDDLFALLK